MHKSKKVFLSVLLAIIMIVQCLSISVFAEAGDTQPPTAPTGLMKIFQTDSSVDLFWSASTDDVGVTGYKVYRNSIEVASCSSTTYSNSGLSPNTSYTYTVKAYDAAGNLSDPSNSLTILTNNNASVKIISLTADKPSPQPEGTAITFTADVSGGTEVQYQFVVSNNSGVVYQGNYSTSNTLTWTPSTVDSNYVVTVYAKDVNSSAEYDDSYSIPFVITQTPIKISSLTADTQSPQVVGTAITFTATATGGTQVLYQFKVTDGNGWVYQGNYSASNTFTWTPSTPGSNYFIIVNAKDINSTAESDDSTGMPFVIQPPVKITSMTANKTSPQTAGTAITFTAVATGGTQILYQFKVSDGNGWIYQGSFSTSNTFTWTPTTPGSNYFIMVFAKDKNSTAQYDDANGIPFVINAAPVKITSVTANKTSPQTTGTPITFTATATGGTQILYQFKVSDGNGWIYQGSFSNSNTFTWTPTTPGSNYFIMVFAKDKNSTAQYDDANGIPFVIT